MGVPHAHRLTRYCPHGGRRVVGLHGRRERLIDGAAASDITSGHSDGATAYRFRREGHGCAGHAHRRLCLITGARRVGQGIIVRVAEVAAYIYLSGVRARAHRLRRDGPHCRRDAVDSNGDGLIHAGPLPVVCGNGDRH